MPLGRGGGVNTHRHFVLSPVSLALRVQDPHLHLRSHGKIGDCEQSTNMLSLFLFIQSGLFMWVFSNIINGIFWFIRVSLSETTVEYCKNVF